MTKVVDEMTIMGNAPSTATSRSSPAAPAAVVASLSAGSPEGGPQETVTEEPRRWLKGLVFCAFTSAEALPLAKRIRKCVGPLKGRGVSPEQLLGNAPPADDELLILPLRQDAGKVLAWLRELRRRGVTAPALLVLGSSLAAAEEPVEGLGAVDFLSLDEVSDFALWRSLKLLERAHQREREVVELARKLRPATSSPARARRWAISPIPWRRARSTTS